MQEIDDMDMPGFLKIRAWDARREHRKAQSEPSTPRKAYIDDVWPTAVR